MRLLIQRILPLLGALAAPLFAQLTITTASPLPTAMVGRAYSTSLASTGGTGTVTYSLPGGPSSLPSGLTMTAQGVISGTPTATTPNSVTIAATDSASTPNTTSKTFALTVLPQLTITTSSPLTTGFQNQSFSQTVAATGGNGTYTWAASGLPTGLSIGLNNGTISGTPTVTGTFSPVITVQDGSSPPFQEPKNFQITINAAPTINTSSLPPATVNSSYSTTLTATGGSGAGYMWSVSVGSLPNGLSLTPSSGLISGTPTASGSFQFTIQVTDSASATASKQFTLTVNPSALTITSTSPLQGGTLNTSYTTAIGFSGGVSPYTFSVITGALPTGVTLTPGNGVLSGTPTAAGVFTFTIQLNDSATPTPATTSKQFTITIAASALSITTSSPLPAATQNVSYSTTLASTGGTSPYTYALQAGSVLPPNLSLSTAGVISGTPTTVNASNSFTVVVTDSGNGTATKPFTLAVNAPSLTISTASPLTSGIQNVAYSTTLAATGASGSLTWSIVNGLGTLPAGLSLTPSTGVISGTPTASGTSNFTVQVTDGTSTVTKAFALTINVPTLSITTSSPLPAGIQNVAYSTTLTPSGGTAVGYAWALQSGSTLPANLTLNTGTGVISGTPAVSGTFNFTVVLTDSSTAQTTKAFALTINPPLSITTASPLTAGTQNSVYSITLAGSGGTTSGYNWTVTVGTLPAGLTLAPTTGVLSGTPTASGTSNFTVQLQDSSNATTTKAFALTINPAPPTITTVSPLPNATINTAYNTTLAANGGSGGYTWSLVNGQGTLPTGLSLTPGTGTISGTPTVLGTSNFTMQVQDSSNATAQKAFSITVSSASSVSITTASPLPAATVGTVYSTTLAASGGTGTYTWSLPSGSVLPGGLTLSSAGVLSGTPTTSGGFNFTVQVNDTGSGTAQKAFAMTVNAASGSLSITTNSLPNWTVGRPYSQTLSGSGGTQPYAWTVSQGALPNGLTLATGGALTGTPTASGTFNFTVQLADNGSTPVTKALSIVIAAAPAISNNTLPNGTVGTVYSSAVVVTGGTAPLSWSVSTGSLPAGLTLNATTGAVSGTPTSGGQSSFAVTVTDAAGATAVQPYTVSISSSLQVTTTTLPNAVVSTSYSTTLAASGGTGTGYTWSITAGALPSGLNLTPGTGLISGAPTATGTFTFTVQVADSGSNTATRALSLTVNSSGLTINTPSPLPQALLGSAYSATFSATGGTSTGYTWSVVGGLLPAGLQLSSAGVLSGTPTAAGAGSFTVEVRDSSNTAAQKLFSIFIANAALTITNSSPLADGIIGVAYSVILQATGGAGSNYTFGLSNGTLPPGLTLSPSGVINGVPTTAGTSNFTILVTDTAGGSATKVFAIAVNSSNLSISTINLPPALVGTPYTTTLAALGGRSPYTWSVTIGALPPGITLDPNSGVLSGTPSQLGSFNFNVQVRDANNLTASASLTLTVTSFSITTSALPAGNVGVAYSAQLQVIGGVAPITYQITGGTLPPGLSFNSSGLLSGTPTGSANTPITFQARDANNAVTPSKALQLVISSNITVTTTTLPAGSIGTAYSATVTASGGSGSYTWGITNGALPVGLSLAGGTGQIRGTPSGPAGSYNFVVQATDSLNATAERQLTIVISALLSVSTTSLPNATPGVAYQQNLQAAGGTQPYTWSLVSGGGNLPQGLTLFNTGQLSGTTTQTGTFNFTVQVTDGNSLTATRQLTLVVGGSTLSVTTATLPNGVIGTTYTATLAASGGTGAGYTWSVVGGLLPSGLSLGTTTGVISGVPSGSPGTSTVTVQVTDSGSATATKQFNIVISPSGQLTVTTSSLPSGVVGTAYATTILQASGGSGTGYVWTVFSGNVPGLTLSQSGALAGTPTTAGSFPFSVQVRDSLNATATQNYTVVITLSNPLSIDTQSLPSGSVGVAYSATIAASGGSGVGYVYSLASGSGALPGGLTLTGAGQITGTPTAAGTFAITVRVTDSLQNTATRGLSITVAGSGPAITTTTLPQGTLGVAYNATLAASGGTAPYTWSVVQGTLPAGLSLTAASGQIIGTPTAAGSNDVTFRVQDNAGLAATRQINLTVTGTGLSITTATLPQGSVGVSYSVSLAAAGGTGPYVWTITQGLIPNGLTLNSATGLISGTPTTAGSTDLVFRVQDNVGGSTTRLLTLTVLASLSIGPATIANPVVGTAYSAQFTATGGTAPYTFSIAAGQLPPGLALGGSGLLAGTPTTAGNASFTVRVQDAFGAAATQQYSVTVTGSSGPLTITTTTLPAGAVGAPYTAQLQATGGTAPYSWSITQGVYPDGLGLISTTGTISGTPSRTETQVITIQVRDSSSPAVTVTRQFTISVTGGGGLSIVTSTLPNATVGVFYSVTLQATGPTPQSTYTWTSEGTLPPGLGVSQAGVLFGTPTTGGSYSFSIRVNESSGQTLARQFTMTVAGGTISITTTAVPNGALGSLYSAPLAVSGGTAPYTWVLSAGQLPPGIGLTASSGLLSGTPTVPGSYNFTVQVTDATNVSATRQLSLTISAGLTVTTTSLAGGSIGQPYSQTLTAAGGSGTGYVWQLTVGSLPPGLTLSSTTGVISGSPTTNGTSNFTVQVTDSLGATATRALSISIGSTLSIVTSNLPNAAVNVFYTQTLSAAGGTAPLQWSVIGNLPVGLTLNTATGVISGTPTTGAVASFTVRVQDATGASATRQLTLLVGEGIVITTATALPNAGEGVAYTQTLAVVGGQAPYTWTVSVGTLPTGLQLNAVTGVISGTPAFSGNYSFIIQASDAAQQTATKAFTLAVGGRVTIVNPAVLSAGTVRIPYSETLIATGGVAPYTWSLAAGGTLPLGVTITPNGEVTGSPSSAGTFSFNVQVVDSVGGTATKSFSLTVLLGLSVTTGATLQPATAGSAYVQTLAAVGGQAPYTWSLSTGNLPTGLTLNAQGILSGTPTVSGTFNFTVLVSDSSRNSATASLSVVVRLPATPTVTITGLGETVDPAQQPRITVGLGTGFPVAVSGTLTLTFTSDATVPLDDPAVVFTNGRRTVDFNIPANTTSAQLPDGFAMQTGTVSGTLRLAVTLRVAGANGADITPDPAPVLTARLAKGAPVIRTVRATRTSTGLSVEITGYATVREITQAVFRFTPAPGSSLQTTELTIPLTEGARTWYQSDSSRPFGSQFTLTQQFNVQGDTSSITSVTVTLANSQGSSQAGTANF